MNSPDTSPTPHDRTLVALIHASILLPGIGIMVPVVLWAKRSRYPEYIHNQTLQALVYQLLQWVWIQLITLVVFFLVFIYAAILSGSQLPPEEYSSRMLTAILISAGAISIAWAVYQLAGLIGAAACLLGKNFQYPIVGDWVINFLRKPKADHQADVVPVPEDQISAAVAHSAILIPVMGFLVPLALSVFDRDKLPFYGFQLTQALIFQLITQGIGVVLAGCQVVLASVIAVPVVYMLSYDQSAAGESMLVILGLIAFILVFFLIVGFLIIPLMATLGIIASIQVLKGKDYYYPVLGKRLARASGSSG